VPTAAPRALSPFGSAEHVTHARLADRLVAVDWPAVEAMLWERPYARLGTLLTPAECRDLASLWDDDRRFRSRVDMERHRFGVGEYRYFGRPLPRLVEELRTLTYALLAPIVNRWAEALGGRERYPARLKDFLGLCAAAGQTRPTPLLLRYEVGGWNALHQDLYGEVSFPLQLVVFLSQPGRDYEGGAFLLVEQRPRAQSVGEALSCARGEAIVFANRRRPVRGTRGFYRSNVRHGVSRVESGRRYTLGVIFHDAL
jgi:uncharacterized protein